ncbi:hypothetical protein LF817_13080 [Halobacillus sp. A1]|uniref:hypothetical protein n=1 Tax=Halobacillus sp. A1 TaxID=2880262 RepID=UPI0020A67045|nr:hypothetical protein [Halobacillus sp. A1]MCP3032274.1 hypothetical protein [Halobacillus sp. A1]
MRLRHVSRRWSVAALFFMLLITTACASSTSPSGAEDKNGETLEAFLTKHFSTADEELVELIESPENNTIIGEEGDDAAEQPDSPTELDVYLEEEYSAYFTEHAYSEYIGSQAFSYGLAAYYNDYQLQVDRVDYKESSSGEEAYDFTVTVDYKKEGREEKSADVSGRVNVNEEGKISRFMIHEDEGLLEAIESRR